MNARIMQRHFSPIKAYQSGAALVVALILLVALSLMAISSMNSASLDLIMAGNEQYRSRAFTTAEAGIERALRGGTFNSGADSSQSSSTPSGDTYSYTITRPNGGNTEKPPSGYSEGESQFGAIYFRITSTGASVRNSRYTSTQEVFQVIDSGDSTTCLITPCGAL